MKSLTPLALALILAGAAAPGSAMAQLRPTTVYAEASELAPAQRDAAVNAIIQVLEEQYVFPDRTPVVVEAIRAAQAAGRYDLTDPAAFATRISEDMSRAANDSHLYLQYDPERFAAASRPSREGAPLADLEAVLEARSRRDHYGLAGQRLLDGNIRYLKIAGFGWVGDETGLAYDDAMRFLRGGDAAIIDLRGNGGGSHDAVRYALSHFLPSDRLLMTFLEAGHEPKQSWTLSHLPAGRMIGKPLYVLIDGSVGSAGEDFAYSIQQFDVGQLVGQTTAGGANNNRFLPVAPGFMLSVSFGRPVHAVSGGNWQGTGVAPDFETPAPQALEAAQVLALDALLANVGDNAGRRSEYEWARTGVEARLHPVTLAPAATRPFAGTYGEAKVEFRDGALWLTTRPGGATRRMLPLTPDGRLFALEGHDMLRARFTDEGLETLWRGEPTPRRHPRTAR